MEFSGFSMGARRDEDIALDMMKFIAGSTSFGRTGPGAGIPVGWYAETGRACAAIIGSVWRVSGSGEGKEVNGTSEKGPSEEQNPLHHRGTGGNGKTTAEAKRRGKTRMWKGAGMFRCCAPEQDKKKSRGKSRGSVLGE
jgi:hypothetical protein